MDAAATAPSERRETSIAWILFALALIFSAWGTTVGWKNDRLAGNEFRQTQTAISALFIQRDHNFSLAYPTPVLGKPWSVPFEFPLYQWTAVWVSNASGLPLTQAARAVSWACLYLTLPALWLLLRRVGVAASARPVVLAVVLVCPLYVFYARAFLIETMALMFAWWFVAATVAAVEQRSLKWLLVANVAGAGAGMVKVTTLLLYLIPLGCWAGLQLWRASRAGDGRSLRQAAGWIFASTCGPVAAAWMWTSYADRVKAQSPVGIEFLSWKLTSYNFGTWADRFSPEIWAAWWRTQDAGIAPWYVLAVAAVVAACVARRWWGWIAACAASYAVAPLIFPVLYAWHEYYFVANAILLAVAIGFALVGLLGSRWPRTAVWTIVATVLGLQAAGYVRVFYPGQREQGTASDGMCDLVRELSAPNDVMIIAGEDWSSVRPYYSQRRAFMIRRALDRNWTYLEQAFAALRGEPVRLLVLRGDSRQNPQLLVMINRFFQLEQVPVASWENLDVYVHPSLRPKFEERLRDVGYRGVALTSVRPAAAPAKPEVLAVSALAPTARAIFQRMSPQPVRCYSQFGLGGSEVEGRQFVNAHPDFRLWFAVSPGQRHLEAEYFIAPGAYQFDGAGDPTDGVEFNVRAVGPEGTARTIFSRLLDPYHVEADRGVQRLSLDLDLHPGEEVMIETDPGPRRSFTRDWASWGAVVIK